MRTKNLMMSMSLAAVVFTSCNKDGNRSDEIQNGEIRLSSYVAAQSRAFGFDIQIPVNQAIAVYMDKAGAPATQIYGKNVMIADGNGGFIEQPAPMYFPTDKSAVDIYAFKTNATLANEYPTATTHKVLADQSDETGQSYANSDLLYAVKRGVKLTKQTVDLEFYHMLSKVEVALEKGYGAPDLDGAEVSIMGTKLKADFTPDKSVDMTNSPTRAAMISSTAADNEPTEIKITNAVSANFEAGVSFNEAIIVPQALTAGDQFIKIVLKDGGELYYLLAKETIFESGKKYTYKITVNLSSLTVSFSVTDWISGGVVEGDAEITIG